MGELTRAWSGWPGRGAGRRNIQHAMRAAEDLGLDLNAMAPEEEGHRSFGSSVEFADRLDADLPACLTSNIRRLTRRRALVICPRLVSYLVAPPRRSTLFSLCFKVLS